MTLYDLKPFKSPNLFYVHFFFLTFLVEWTQPSNQPHQAQSSEYLMHLASKYFDLSTKGKKVNFQTLATGENSYRGEP